MEKKRELISARTRDAFRDAAVAMFKVNRGNCFERLTIAGLEPVGLPNGRVPSVSELMEGYYAAVDWTDRRSIEPFIAVFEDVYRHAPDSVWGHREELTERLFRDGLQITSGRLAKLPI